jgi:hypothetical protein
LPSRSRRRSWRRGRRFWRLGCGCVMMREIAQGEIGEYRGAGSNRHAVASAECLDAAIHATRTCPHVNTPTPKHVVGAKHIVGRIELPTDDDRAEGVESFGCNA